MRHHDVKTADQKWGCGCVIINDKNKFLMGLRCKPGDAPEWCLIGGSIENGETPYDGVHREIVEECGLIPFEVRLIDEHTENGKTDFLFICRDFSGKAVPQPGELSELRWVTLAEARKFNLFPATKISLDILEAKRILMYEPGN